ncbi:hypothetical protein SHVI106290_16695 [Shewanella violacea]
MEPKTEAPSNGPASSKLSALYRSIKLRLLNAAISPYYHMKGCMLRMRYLYSPCSFGHFQA